MTVRAIGPTSSCVWLFGTTPLRLTRPRVGRTPTRLFADAGDRRYGEYLRATDPGRITQLYDEAVLFDRVATASIITGEVLIATGIYLAFLRRPEPPRVSAMLEPARCGVSLRF